MVEAFISRYSGMIGTGSLMIFFGILLLFFIVKGQLLWQRFCRSNCPPATQNTESLAQDESGLETGYGYSTVFEIIKKILFEYVGNTSLTVKK